MKKHHRRNVQNQLRNAKRWVRLAVKAEGRGDANLAAIARGRAARAKARALASLEEIRGRDLHPAQHGK